MYASIGVKNWVNLALYDSNYIDLTDDSVKILGTIYLCNKKPAHDERNIINRMAKTETMLRIWRNITIKSKIVVFTTLEILKIVCLVLVTDVLLSIFHFTKQNTY